MYNFIRGGRDGVDSKRGGNRTDEKEEAEEEARRGWHAPSHTRNLVLNRSPLLLLLLSSSLSSSLAIFTLFTLHTRWFYSKVPLSGGRECVWLSLPVEPGWLFLM